MNTPTVRSGLCGRNVWTNNKHFSWSFSYILQQQLLKLCCVWILIIIIFFNVFHTILFNFLVTKMFGVYLKYSCLYSVKGFCTVWICFSAFKRFPALFHCIHRDNKYQSLHHHKMYQFFDFCKYNYILRHIIWLPIFFKGRLVEIFLLWKINKVYSLVLEYNK